MIRPVCIMCDKELEQLGAIFLSSPGLNGMCHKHHICVRCEKVMWAFITGLKIKQVAKNTGGRKYGR